MSEKSSGQLRDQYNGDDMEDNEGNNHNPNANLLLMRVNQIMKKKEQVT
jgi:hypothetical protein